MIVIKRDGRSAPFNAEKIEIAILKAMIQVGQVDESKARKISLELENNFKEKKEISIYSIENAVIASLFREKLDVVAQEYKRFRNERTKTRESTSTLISKINERINATNIENSNANVDERSFSGREKEASSDVQKFMAIELEGLEKEVAIAHKEMLIYQHDLDKALIGMHNCLQVNFQEIFTHGFKTRNGDVRPPSSFSTACQLVAVAFQCQSQVQFGGVGTIHLDYDLAPFVRKSFFKHFKDGLKYVEKTNLLEPFDVDNYPIDGEIYKSHKMAYEYAMDMTEREGLQSCQALYHNLNTLESRQGAQVPFTSINLGRDTSFEGRLVNKWIFQASLDGIGKHHLTSIFPISIFQYKSGVNANPGDPNYDLKQLALESLSKRIYPNFVNGDWSEAHEEEGNIDTMMATMGCRTMIGYDRNGQGYNRQGRGNNVPNTIILPKLGLEYGIALGHRAEPDLKGFWNAFEETLKLTEKGLLNRYSIMKKQAISSAPFMYDNNTIAGSRDCENSVEEALKHNTLAIGFLGVSEMCYALFGTNHVHSEEVRNFAYTLVKRINEFASEASARNGLNFSAYATPAEGLCSTALESLKRQYGIVPNVTDRDYLTNSFHVPVWEKVSIYEKLRIEAPFTTLCTGGTITYVELESTFMNNLKAIEDVIDYAFKELNIPYLALNFPIDSCLDCGYQSEFNEECPQCGSQNIQQLRRVTGYLTTDYRNFNKGKIAETEERAKHSAYTSEVL